MKKIIYILLFGICFSSKAQVNLVPNGSFEDTIPCTMSSVFAAVGWYSVNASPDYYNSIYTATCGYNSTNLPNYSPDGNGIIGYSTYCTPGICGPNNREWIQTQ